MRDAADVTVQRAVVHKIDHLGDGTVYSEVELDLDANETLREYFAKQVAKALADEGTHAARFAKTGSQDAKDECYRLLVDDKKFVRSSRRLAELLLAAMQGDNRIAPGSLAVCVYTASNYPDARFLALIKLDPGKALVQQIETVGEKTRVGFKIQPNVMPTDKERLHKAALIPPAGTVAKYDLLLLDLQQVQPAAFWATTFLNTTVAFDARTTTERLYLAIQNARDLAGLTPDESDAVQDWVTGTLQNESVTVSTLVRRLPVAKEKKRLFTDQIRELLPGEERLELDPDFAEKRLLKKTRLRGDFGVRIEVLTQHWKDVVKSETPRTVDGVVVTTLVLEVPNLRRGS